MTKWSAEKIETTIAEIQKRSVTDSDFRNLALTDPSAAVLAVSGEPLPSGMKFRFVNQLDEVIVVLPPASNDELAESQLDQVSGGIFWGGIGGIGGD